MSNLIPVVTVGGFREPIQPIQRHPAFPSDITTRFMTELRALLAKRGAVDECARAIGVNREAVSRWKSGKLLPGCENTLKLLEWMPLGAQSRILTPIEPKTEQE